MIVVINSENNSIFEFRPIFKFNTCYICLQILAQLAKMSKLLGRTLWLRFELWRLHLWVSNDYCHFVYLLRVTYKIRPRPPLFAQKEKTKRKDFSTTWLLQTKTHNCMARDVNLHPWAVCGLPHSVPRGDGG
jgi:hypothetical protein